MGIANKCRDMFVPLGVGLHSTAQASNRIVLDEAPVRSCLLAGSPSCPYVIRATMNTHMVEDMDRSWS